MTNREIIAKNIAALLHDGDFVNLGVGIPTLVSNYIPKDITVLLHAENGCVGQDRQLDLDIYATKETAAEWFRQNGDAAKDWRNGHRDMYNAGDQIITLLPGGCCFDSVTAFAMARGGHLDATVLGALQVDQQGNLANWNVPGKAVKGMGGAMDLVSGAKKVIVAMEHNAKSGAPKILKNCTFPLTAVQCVDIICTEYCMIECREGKLVVVAMNPNISREALAEKTEAVLTFAADIREMAV